MRIERQSRDGVATVLFRGDAAEEASITVRANGCAHVRDLLEEAWDEVRRLGMVVLRQDVFGVPSLHGQARDMLRKTCGSVDWPVTWLEEGASQGESLTGTYIHAIRGAEVKRIVEADRVFGSVYTANGATSCHLGGVVAENLKAGPVAQTEAVLERVERLLGTVGMTFGNVARTWFYNDRILEWYGDFNRVRTRFFRERGIFDGLVPASTGIGGGNLDGAALVTDVLAVRADAADGGTRVVEVASPLQCPATNYRSSFSRAVEISGGGARRLLVSGTAGIDPDGGTACVGDVAGQIELTLDVVAAILQSRGMAWQDVTRSIAYVKAGADAARYREALAARGLPDFPGIVTENDICRGDLLFELEVDACRAS